jgi:outer membrane protein TolC
MPRNFVLMMFVCFGSGVLAQEQIDMSLRDTLNKAIERNLDLQLERITLETRQLSLQSTRAVYEPTVTSFMSQATRNNEVTQATEGDSGQTFTSEFLNWNSSFRKSEDFGLQWSVDFNNSLNNPGNQLSLGDTYSSDITFGVQQSLLRGFSWDRIIPRYDEYIARSDLGIAKEDLEIRMVAVLQQAENAYWDLVLAVEDFKVAEQSLELAKQLFEENKVKIEVGTLPSIELVNNQATIAQREAELVTAENAVLTAEDQLKKVLNLPPNEWERRIVPSDPIVIPELETNFEADLSMAMKNRPEMAKTDIEMEKAQLTRKLRVNELKPDLTFSAGYETRGVSSPIPILETAQETENGFEADTLPSSFESALSKVVGNELPGWSVSLNLSWNPLNKAAKINLAQADAEIKRAELNAEVSKLDIMEQVRSSTRELNSNLKSIRANEQNLKFQRENLKAEVQKFQNGLSTNYLVSEAQNQVATAESQLNSARINYLKAIVEYHRSLGLLLEKRNISIK